MSQELLSNSLELSDLEVQIDCLIHAIEKFKTENHQLRDKLASIIRENTILKELNQKAAARVTQIINQLKENT